MATKNKLIVKCVFMFIFFYSSAFGETEPPIKPEDVAVLYTVYEYTLNRNGLESLTCKKSPQFYYDYISAQLRDFKLYLRAFSVNFGDEGAHDHSDIKCDLIERNDKSAIVMCSGFSIINDSNGVVFEKKYIENKVELIMENNRFVYCPSN